MAQRDTGRRGAAGPDHDTRRLHHRSPGCGAVLGDDRHAGHRSDQRGLRRARRHGRAARRLLRVADHQEHPRRQGLHLFALQRGVDALPRCVLGAERRNHHERHRARDQGGLRRDRSAPGRAAVRQGARRHPELSRRHVRLAELQPRRDHEPAGVHGSARPAGELRERIREEGLRRHAGEGDGGREKIPDRRPRDHRRRRRSQGDRAAVDGIREDRRRQVAVTCMECRFFISSRDILPLATYRSSKTPICGSSPASGSRSSAATAAASRAC